METCCNLKQLLKFLCFCKEQKTSHALSLIQFQVFYPRWLRMLGYNFSYAVTKKIFNSPRKLLILWSTWGPQTRILLMLLTFNRSIDPSTCSFVCLFVFHFLIKISELKSIYTVGRASEWSLNPHSKRTQQCWMLMLRPLPHPVAYCGMLLRIVGSWCAKFETSQSFEPKLLTFLLFCDCRSVVKQCWIRFHSSSNSVGTTHAH